MLNKIKNYIVGLSSDSSIIKLVDVIIHDEKKLVVILSKNDYMASFEVLPNYEYDFLVINENDEAIVLNKSKKLDNIQELMAEIEEDYNAFAEQ
jgi:hypothetical protein